MEYDENFYGFVYITTNRINNKKYIGQKKYDKKKEYLAYLGSGKALNNAINKYGRENFYKDILFNAKDKFELNEMEKYYIKYYNAIESKEFYNIAIGGNGGDTMIGYSEEEKLNYSKKLSLTRKGVINQGSNNPSSKKCICLNTLKIYDNVTIASQENKINRSVLYKCLNGEQKYVKINNELTCWEYYDDTKDYSNYKHLIENEYKTKNTISLLLCVETGDIYTSKELCEKLNITPHKISSRLYLYKKYKTRGGFEIDGTICHFVKIGNKVVESFRNRINMYS